MTQTVVWEGYAGRSAGILLRRSQEAGDEKKVFLEILLPAGAALPETGTGVKILPPGQKGTVLHCRITGRNGSFLRFIAEVRLGKPSPQTRKPGQTTPE